MAQSPPLPSASSVVHSHVPVAALWAQLEAELLRLDSRRPHLQRGVILARVVLSERLCANNSIIENHRSMTSAIFAW